MANSVCQVFLTETPLLIPVETARAETGATVDFWGIVREMEGDARIIGIDYEAHREMAQHQLERVAEQAREKFQLTRVAIWHRIGFVPVGEASLLVRVGGRHRAAAFRASASVVDELKKCAPIWKHPVFKEGAPPKEDVPRAKDQPGMMASSA
jgi:molybdopterin synthase catalytic subunit